MPNVCNGCLGELPVLSGPVCTICAQPTPGGGPCGRCLGHPPPYRRTVAALGYVEPAASLVHRFKFGGDLAVGTVLAHVMVRAVARHGWRPDRLVPVPLSPARRRERGFDQALELARTLGHRLDIPLAGSRVRRPVDRGPQSALSDWAMRRRNVRGVFHVEPGWATGRHLAIVDDVMTSGATAHALAGALTGAGATTVDVWVACRAGLAGSWGGGPPPGTAHHPA